MIRKLIKLKEEKGQAFVELAIALPVLLLILCGIVDYGWIFTNQNIIDNAAREGARFAIIHSEDTDAVTEIKNYVKSVAPANFSDSFVIEVTFSNPLYPRLGDVTVNVKNTIEALTPIAGIFNRGQKINLDSETRMKVE